MNDLSINHWLIVLVIVWFISRLFKTRFSTHSDKQKQSIKRPSEQPLIHWESLGEFEFEVVGESLLTTTAFQFSLTPTIVLRSLVFSLVMGLNGGFLPAIRAANLNIVAALRAH
jgi:ABC-type antimicrobial peptide transport system permease subunit